MQTHTKYSPRTDVDWEEIKKESLKYCTGNYDDGRSVTEADVVEDLIHLWNALKSVDFNINLFFSQKLYLEIPDDGLTGYILTVCLMAVKPISVFVVDWMNGYLDFDSINPIIAEGAEWKPADEFEILEYLWYSRKDEDIWWLLGQGVGDIKKLLEWYMGTVQPPIETDGQFPPCYYKRNEVKALLMIMYLKNIAKSNKAVAEITSLLYDNSDEVRQRIWTAL